MKKRIGFLSIFRAKRISRERVSDISLWRTHQKLDGKNKPICFLIFSSFENSLEINKKLSKKNKRLKLNGEFLKISFDGKVNYCDEYIVAINNLNLQEAKNLASSLDAKTFIFKGKETNNQVIFVHNSTEQNLGTFIPRRIRITLSSTRGNGYCLEYLPQNTFSKILNKIFGRDKFNRKKFKLSP